MPATMERQRQRHAWLLCKESSSVRDRARVRRRSPAANSLWKNSCRQNKCVAFAARASWSQAPLPLRRMLPAPLVALFDHLLDGLTRLFFGHTPQAVAQVHLEHPRAEAFVIGMAADPEAFRPLKAVGGFVEIIQPFHRALDFRRLPLHRVGRDVARPLDRLRLRIEDLGLKLCDLIVLVNHEGGQEGRRHSENTSQHSGWIVLGCWPRVSAWT